MIEGLNLQATGIGVMLTGYRGDDQLSHNRPSRLGNG